MSTKILNLRWKGLVILSLWLIQLSRITEGASISTKDNVKLETRGLRPYRATFTHVVRDFRTLFDYVIKEDKKSYNTMTFSTESEPELKWYIRSVIYADALQLHLYVGSLPSTVDTISGYSECGLIDAKGEKRYFKGDKGSASKNGYFPRYFQGYVIIKLDELNEKAKELLPDEQLTTQCEIKGVLYLNKTNIAQIKTEQIRGPVNASSDCAKDIGSDTLDKLRLFEDDMRGDIEFKSSDKRFKCHSIMVYARMPLFNLSSIVADPKRVVVYDLTEEVTPEELEDMMAFMYRGKASNLDKTCRVLYGVASKYGFECLKSTCEEVLIGQVKATNAKDYLKIGQEIGSVRLEKKAGLCIYKPDDEKCSV